MSIFVSVVSYRDPDVQNTVDDLFAKAADPSAVFVGVFLQIDNEIDQDCLIKPRPNVRIETIDAKDARGVGYARSKAQGLWRGEDFFFQIDSHMRFAQGWDCRLLDMYAECGGKSVISTYPLPFIPPNSLNADRLVRIEPKKFDTDGVLLQKSGMYPIIENQKMERTAFIAGGMLFGPSSMITEVPYDPYIFFTGEEITMAARLWTHGYDIWVPNKPVAYHNYLPAPERPRIWKDDEVSKKMSALSRARVLWMLGNCSRYCTEALTDLNKYDLGIKRLLSEYEQFSGLDFRRRLYRGIPL